MPPGDPRTQARRGVERRPGDAIAWIVLSEAELDAGDVAAGRAAAERALSLAPGHPEALARLGRAQWMRGDMQAAVASLRAAARGAPLHPGIAVWLGHVLEDAGEAEAASDTYAHAYALAPHEAQIAAYLLAWRRKLCDWRDLDALSAQVRAAVRQRSVAVEPFAFLSEEAIAEEQLQCARLKAAQIAPVTQLAPAPQTGIESRVLRIGFLSNGFGAHPTGLLIVALVEALRRLPQVEVQLFALNADDGSEVRSRLQASASLHDVSLQSYASIAQRIRAARIEVLFDLRGWGGGGVPEVLAMRPAPVQVNWLAYPGTSGAPWIDYVLADRFVLPESMAPSFSESVAWLPRCFQPSDNSRVVPAARPREAYGLPAQGVVFCCFNNSYKLNPRSMRRAFAILRGVPGSVLWLLSGPGAADERLRVAADVDDVPPSRLLFMPKQPHPEYLARLQHADLFLDTTPYNAHTTASDAIWAGCPVLTVPGGTFAARVSGSLNQHLGMPSLNMADDDAFIRRAVALGNDRDALAVLRSELGMRRATSPLFDMNGFARDFATITLRMAERRRRGEAPVRLGD